MGLFELGQGYGCGDGGGEVVMAVVVVQGGRER